MIRNGDFEKFSGDNPVGWETSNIPGSLTVVSSSPAGYKGTRAVKCSVKDFYGAKLVGLACQKGITLLGKELELSGYYTFHGIGKDVGVAVVSFQNAAGSTLGTEEVYFRDEQTEFARFAKEFKAPDGAVGAQVRLSILGDPETGTLHPGSFAVFDDLKLIVAPPRPKPAIQRVDSAQTK
jgi:hypothetical protein